MLQKICIYNSKIYTSFDTYLIAYSYKSQDQHFSECLKIKIPAKCIYVNEIALEVVNNHLTGLKSLIILVFDFKKLCSTFIYNDSCRTQLFKITLPIGPVALEDYCIRMFVSDGPTFLYQSKDAIDLFSVPRRINGTFDNSLVCSSNKEYKILQFKCFGPFKALDSLIFLSLLIICYDFPSRQSVRVVGFVSDIKNSAINCDQLPLHLFFPECYETVLKTVEITKVLPSFKTRCLNLKDVSIKESVSIICTKDECLVFLNAVLTYCCKLTVPLSEVVCIKSEFSSCFSENMHLILMLENKTVFFIAIKKKIICEVVKYWTDTDTTLVGDILKKGSKQVLLLKQSDFDFWQNNCILYDMLSFMPFDLLCHSAMPDECLKTTINGLEKKVQVGKLIFKETEHEISQKSAATIDALIKLNEFKVNNEWLQHSDIFQESLVDLILSKDENKTANIPQESQVPVKLLQKNQRFINKQWVVSLFFKNEGERSICYPSIKLLMKDNQVTCFQKLFVHSSDNFSFCDKYSRQINPKGRFTILLNFEPLTFYAEDIFLILTWYNGSTDEFDNEIFLEEDRKVLIQHQLCLQIEITLSDIMKYQMIKAISSPADILFLRASQQRVKLCISSLHSSISRLEDILIRSDTNFSLHLFRSSSVKCIAFKNEKSLLFGIHIILQKSEQNIVEIEAYIKNEMEILLLIQYLYEHLPKDIIISPQVKSKDECSQMKREVANSMKTELDLLLSSLSIHNISEGIRKNYSKLMSSQMAGTIIIPKLTYNRIRSVLVKREFITDSIFKNVSTSI